MTTSPNFGARSSRQIKASAATYLLLAFFQRGLSVLILPFVTRVMDPAEYGAVSVVTATSALVGVLLGSSLELVVFRWAARSDRDSAAVLRWCRNYLYFIVPTIAALGAVVLWFVSADIFGISSQTWAIEILAAGMGPAIEYFALPLIRARDHLVRFVILSGTYIVVLASGKVVLVVLLDQGLRGWVISDLIAAVVAYPLAVVLAKTEKTSIGRETVHAILHFAAPLLPHRISFWALSSLSRPMMALVMPLNQVGVYSLAFNFAAISSIVLAEINRAVLLEYSRESFPVPNTHTRKAVRIQSLAAIWVPVTISAGIAVTAPLIIGPEFIGSLPLIAILGLSQVAYGLYLIPMNYIVQTAGRTRLSWISSTSGAGTIFTLILVFGGSTGAVGVAWFTVLGYALMAFTAYLLARVLALQIDWRRVSPPLAAAVFAIVAWLPAAAALSAQGDYVVSLLCASVAMVLALLSLNAGRKLD